MIHGDPNEVTYVVGAPHPYKLLDVVDDVFPVALDAVLRARTITLGHPRLSARDAVHLAIMESQSITRIMSFDQAFDGFPEIQRVGE